MVPSNLMNCCCFPFFFFTKVLKYISMCFPFFLSSPSNPLSPRPPNSAMCFFFAFFLDLFSPPSLRHRLFCLYPTLQSRSLFFFSSSPTSPAFTMRIRVPTHVFYPQNSPSRSFHSRHSHINLVVWAVSFPIESSPPLSNFQSIPSPPASVLVTLSPLSRGPIAPLALSLHKIFSVVDDAVVHL